MKPEEIKLDDWQRILVGGVPATFFIELIIRAAVVYLIIIVAMRLMGKRMSAQLTSNELAALVSLAAGVGIPIQSPDRGLIPGIIIAAVLVTAQRFIASRSFANEKFDRIAQGNIAVLVENGVMNLEIMGKNRITRDRVCGEVRAEGLTHLGQVKRLYMESSGAFTLIKNQESKPGLLVVPDWDTDFLNELKKSDTDRVCAMCGHIQPNARDGDSCPVCGHQKWVPAIVS
jgi:uncharacterized membrane protein YcaP (DUF421 family)